RVTNLLAESGQTYVWATPAPSPVFNSITNNPIHGDERNFLQCLDLTAQAHDWSKDVVALDGHTYRCYLYFDNDLTPAYAAMPSPYQGENPLSQLHNARAKVILWPQSERVTGIQAVLAADNTNPPKVWDYCNFYGARPFKLTYVAGSARMFTDGVSKDGVPIEYDSTFTSTGALLGDGQDGNLGQHSGYILFNVTVKAS
ncbi:MAG: hypothetical protein ACRDRL_15105, partial [Sciscionella sp.]